MNLRTQGPHWEVGLMLQDMQDFEEQCEVPSMKQVQ
jgi:hypothetical protein